MTFRQRVLQLERTRWMPAAQIIIGLVVSVILAWLALRGVEWHEVLNTFKRFPPVLLFVALVPMFISMWMRAARWKLLLKNEPVTTMQVFLTQNTGIGLNNLLPIRMVSEPIQLAVITRRYRVNAAESLATLVASNTLDVFATAILMATGVMLIPQLRGASIQLVGAFVLLLLSIIVLIVTARGASALPGVKKIRLLQQMVVSMVMLRKSPRRLLLSFMATLGHWLFLGMVGWVVMQGMNINISAFAMTTVLVASIFFTATVPSAPGGIGTYEAAMIYTLRQLGVEASAAAAFAVMMHLILFLPPTLIALFMGSRMGADLVFRRTTGPDSDETIEQQAAQPTSQAGR